METVTLKYDDLPSYIGTRLRIEKMGLDHQVAVFEGVIRGPSEISQIAPGSMKPDRRWTMVLDSGKLVYFVPEGDSWKARRV
jgi:hypothetical protein